MSATPNLSLPYIAPSQAQKHVTHNESLKLLDALVQLVVLTRGGVAPPATPADGERHIPGVGTTGDWTGAQGKVAAYQDGAWSIFEPGDGWIAWVEGEQKAIVRAGTAWIDLVPPPTFPDSVAQFGVNTAASATNRLAVKADAVLLSHDDVTPGSGDMRQILNKAAYARNASQLYQNGWSGRAETGLNGSDDYSIKVSPNGSSWKEALIIDSASGAVRLPRTPPVAPMFNLLKDGGRFAGSPEPQGTGASTFVPPAYLLPVNGATIAQGPKFITNSSTYGGTGAALDPVIQTLVERLRDGDNSNVYRRYGVEFFTLAVTAGAGVATSLVAGGVTYYMVLSIPAVALPSSLSFNFHVLVQSGALALMANDDYVSTHVDGTAFSAHQVIQPADGWKQVTRLMDRDSRKFSGYHNIVKRLYATPGTQFVIALPVVTPGVLPTSPGLLHGLLASAEAWR